MVAIATKNLTKRFGTFTAVDAVNLTVAEGEVYALIGPNGAGKTTLIKMLVGLLIPTGGSATISGSDIMRRPLSAKKEIGYVPDDPSAYDYLTGLEFLMLTGRLRGMKETEVKKRIDEMMPLFPIADIVPTPIAQYSRGNKQKVAILAALMTKPKTLIIDEPIVGLDPASIDMLGAMLVKYAREGHTVFFVTHILSFAQKYAQRVGVMKEGTIKKETVVDKAVALETLL
jgi:ABC-2 type transport system ATP-binding protein